MSEFYPPAMGWHEDPAEVALVLSAISAEGGDPIFATAAADLLAEADDDEAVFFWEAEQKVTGRVLGSWDQGRIGTCVSFGYGRGSQDLMFLEIANGEAEEWPGKEVATEPIYGGSRVEVGGGRIRGEGSVGAWAAKWVKDWGIVLRDKYGSYDLTAYNEARATDYGRTGVPDLIEQVARQHPVTAVALLKDGDELWAAIGAWKPVPVCSSRGFTRTLRDGFSDPSGQWNHCMQFRGRFTSPRRGKSVVLQNSWGGYLQGGRWIEDTKRGRIELPEGCFATTLDVAASMIRANDSFALAGLNGWKRERIDYTP